MFSAKLDCAIRNANIVAVVEHPVNDVCSLAGGERKLTANWELNTPWAQQRSTATRHLQHSVRAPGQCQSRFYIRTSRIVPQRDCRGQKIAKEE